MSIPMIYFTVVTAMMALFAIFSQIRATRRFAMFLFILEGLIVLGGGAYLFFKDMYRDVSYVCMIAGVVFVLIGLILFKVLGRQKPMQKHNHAEPPMPPSGSESPKY